MEKDYIYNVLLERGYGEKSARLVTTDLMLLHEPLDTYFEKWVQNESDIIDYGTNGYSVRQLMEERGASSALTVIMYVPLSEARKPSPSSSVQRSIIYR